MGIMKQIAMDADDAILDQDYEGIRDQDGWETLELTVRDAHPPLTADYILEVLAR